MILIEQGDDFWMVSHKPMESEIGSKIIYRVPFANRAQLEQLIGALATIYLNRHQPTEDDATNEDTPKGIAGITNE